MGTTDGDVLTELMVEMSCSACVKDIRSKVGPLEGVKSVEVDLENQVVKVFGSAPVKVVMSAIQDSGRRVRTIGQGIPSEYSVSAAVAEFKGPDIHGIVRFAQVSTGMLRVDADFSGLKPGKHGWSINMYGDLTRGAASTGGIYTAESTVLGDLGTLEVKDCGGAEFSGTKIGVQVQNLVGRAVVIYEGEDKSECGVAAAVIARSAGVGQNYKTLCSCDGTVIWEATNSDYVRAPM